MNMNTKTLKMLVGACLVLLARNALAAPSVPLALNYQGLLQPDAGALTAGSYGLQFRIYSAPSSGTQLWARAFSPVYVASNGVFNVTLTDAGTELLTPPRTSDLLAAFAGGPVYLGLTVVQTPSGPVASPREITPVRPFLSFPYSVTANLADTANSLQNVSTNLLSRSANWPSGVYAIGYSNVTGKGSAVPLNGIIDVVNDGLSLSSLAVMGNVSVSQLRVPSLSPPWGWGLMPPVRMLQPAGQPSGSITTLPMNTPYTITATKQGLLALTLPAQNGYTVRLTNSFTQAAYTLTGSASGLQSVTFVPMIAGSQLTITLTSGAMPGYPTYQFLAFGVPAQ